MIRFVWQRDGRWPLSGSRRGSRSRCGRRWPRRRRLLPAAAGFTSINTDMAVLEAQDVRKDLACTVTPDKPHAWLRSAVPCGLRRNVPS